ncbi:hypothetical protein [Zymobacter sp. IVIA_12111.31 C1]|uniref:hypothetical protein n=1 Tax=Zymobacter sp. IVIA_12111.31 C1 TaxID=3394854 RepID=UPI0039C3405A
MTNEDVFLFIIYKIAKFKNNNRDMQLIESLVPFEEIKKSFYKLPVLELEYIASSLVTKGLIAGTENKTSMSFSTEMFTPGNFGDVNFRLTPDGFNRVMYSISIIKEVFCEIYSLCKNNSYRPVVVDTVTLHELEEKGLEHLEKIGCVDVIGRMGTVLSAAKAGRPEGCSNKPGRAEIGITEDGLVFAHEHYQNCK